MIVVIAAVNPGMLMVIAVVIAIVVAFVVPGARDHAAGAHRGNGEHQAGDYNSCCVFHGVSLSDACDFDFDEPLSGDGQDDAARLTPINRADLPPLYVGILTAL